MDKQLSALFYAQTSISEILNLLHRLTDNPIHYREYQKAKKHLAVINEIVNQYPELEAAIRQNERDKCADQVETILNSNNCACFASDVAEQVRNGVQSNSPCSR